MNRWGSGPWSNQGAAYWLTELLCPEAVRRVAETLRLDAVEYHQEIRAAAAMLFVLHRAQRWPAETASEALAVAISRLEEIQHKGLYTVDPHGREAVAKEIDILRGALLEIPWRAAS